MDDHRTEIRADRILLDGIRSSHGRWILGANALVVGLYLLSPWRLGEVLVAFWLEAAVVAGLFAVFVAVAPGSGPTLLHRGARVALWMVLAGGFLTLTGMAMARILMLEGMPAGTPGGAEPGLAPSHLTALGVAALGTAPWAAVGWVVLRTVSTFSDVLVQRRFHRGIGLAASRFFVVYLPALAGIGALYFFTEGALERLFPILFLGILTYYELVLALRVLPLMANEE